MPARAHNSKCSATESIRLKLRAVFISHLHGDHVFGLFPLISTLGLYGRRTPLKIFGPAPLGEMLGCHLRYFDTQLPYEIEWVEVDTTRHALLFENRTRGVERSPASPHPHLRLPVPGETAPAGTSARRKSRNTDSRSPGSRPPSEAKIFCSTTETRSPMRN